MKTSSPERLPIPSYPTLAPLLLILIFTLIYHISSFPQRIENLFMDLRLQLRASLGWTPPAPKKLIIVGIDEPSLTHFGGWPWSRDVHGDFIRLLAAADPAVVAFDIMFTEPRDAEKDAYLAKAASELKKLITGAMSDLESARTAEEDLGLTRPITQITGDISKVQGSSTGVLPIPELRAHSYFGFVNSNPSHDGIRRTLPLVIRMGNHLYPSLVLQALIVAHEIPLNQIHVHLGRHITFPLAGSTQTIPINEIGEYTLNYRDYNRYTSISYISLMEALTRTYAAGEPWPDGLPTLQNAIVLVGQNASGLTDLGPTPLAPMTPLVFVHLTALANILEGDHIVSVSPWLIGAIWLLITVVTLRLLQNAAFALSIGIPIFIALLYGFLAVILSKYNFTTLPVFWPIVGFLLSHIGATLIRWRAEQQSKAHLKNIFGSYIAPGVLNELMKDPANINLGGQRKPVTILFSDIRSFTTISEGADEIALVDQLNEYFEKMVACVNAQGGTLHKYIGDAIMAVWGDVISGSTKKDATAAVRSALAMRHALVELNEYWKSTGRQTLKIGIGLNHGTVLVGNIGATQRKEFTVIGDAVNLASRLEGVTKIFHTDLLISDTVHDLIPPTILTRTLALVQVKGKHHPVRIYEVLTDTEDKIHPPHPLSADWVARYEEGLALFYDRQFRAARNLFAECLETHPNDYCARGYYDLCEENLRHPPDDSWQGVFVLDSK
jgi:adenylate cyclase